MHAVIEAAGIVLRYGDGWPELIQGVVTHTCSSSRDEVRALVRTSPWMKSAKCINEVSTNLQRLLQQHSCFKYVLNLRLCCHMMT